MPPITPSFTPPPPSPIHLRRPLPFIPPPPPHLSRETVGHKVRVAVLLLCTSSGDVLSRWLSWAPRPNEPYGFCGSKATLNHAYALVSVCPQYINPTSEDIKLYIIIIIVVVVVYELRSWVKVEVAVLGSRFPNKPEGFCGRKATLKRNVVVWESTCSRCVSPSPTPEEVQPRPASPRPKSWVSYWCSYRRPLCFCLWWIC